MANGLNVSGITNAAKKKIACQNPYAARQARLSVPLAITKAYPPNLMAARSFAAAVPTCTPRRRHGNFTILYATMLKSIGRVRLPMDFFVVLYCVYKCF